jgi:hypothetical protein
VTGNAFQLLEGVCTVQGRVGHNDRHIFSFLELLYIRLYCFGKLTGIGCIAIQGSKPGGNSALVTANE